MNNATQAPPKPTSGTTSIQDATLHFRDIHEHTTDSINYAKDIKVHKVEQTALDRFEVHLDSNKTYTPLTPLASQQLLSYLKIPTQILARLKHQDRIELVNALVATADPMLIRRNGSTAYAILPHTYQPLNSYAVLKRLTSVLGADHPVTYDFKDYNYSLSWQTNPPLSYSNSPDEVGDFTHIQWQFSDSATGHGALAIREHHYRLICSNGMTLPTTANPNSIRIIHRLGNGKPIIGNDLMKEPQTPYFNTWPLPKRLEETLCKLTTISANPEQYQEFTKQLHQTPTPPHIARLASQTLPLPNKLKDKGQQQDRPIKQQEQIQHYQDQNTFETFQQLTSFANKTNHISRNTIQNNVGRAWHDLLTTFNPEHN